MSRHRKAVKEKSCTYVSFVNGGVNAVWCYRPSQATTTASITASIVYSFQLSLFWEKAIHGLPQNYGSFSLSTVSSFYCFHYSFRCFAGNRPWFASKLWQFFFFETSNKETSGLDRLWTVQMDEGVYSYYHSELGSSRSGAYSHAYWSSPLIVHHRYVQNICPGLVTFVSLMLICSLILCPQIGTCHRRNFPPSMHSTIVMSNGRVV